jgi:hypothetical protein
MTAGIYHLTIEQGATYNLSLTYKDSAGTAIDLTGYTARMQLRRRVDDSVVVVDLTTENSGIALGGASGTIDVTISATVTSAMVSTEGVYDLELISGSVVDRIIKGTYTVDREVTR